MKIWDRLDEVIGAGMLTSMAFVAMFIGYDSSITQMCITGVVALLAVDAVKKHDNGNKRSK